MQLTPMAIYYFKNGVESWSQGIKISLGYLEGVSFEQGLRLRK